MGAYGFTPAFSDRAIEETDECVANTPRLRSSVHAHAHIRHAARSASDRLQSESHRAFLEGDLNTIIGVNCESESQFQSLLIDRCQANAQAEPQSSRRLVKIRAADSSGQRSSASILIKRMYATRGYTSAGLPQAGTDTPDLITLTASEFDTVMGTVSIAFDSPAGLLCDQVYPDEVSGLRERGLRLCEFTKLAVDRVVRSKRVLASLFHVAYIYAHRIKEFDQLLIEVNPRHVRYYEHMLGFTVSGPQRMNGRVHAPAVLLALDFGHAREQISRSGGRPELVHSERSLFPLFFSAAEEAGIVARVRRSVSSEASAGSLG